MTLRAPAIGTDTDSAETFRLAMGGLWVPNSALNARTGVTSTPVLTGTGNFTATVSPFTAVVDGTSNSLQGCYPVAVDVATTVTIGAANTQPRIDLISLQIQDNAYDGSGFSRGQLVVTAGTPAGSPVAPAAPANSLPLWTVPVAANATSVAFSSATAAYQRTAAAGGIVPVGVSTDKPATVNGVAYRHRLDVGAGGVSPLEWSTDGATYNPVFDPSTLNNPTWTPLTLISGYTFATLSVAKIGNQVFFKGGVSTNVPPTSGVNFCTTLPAACSTSSVRWMPVQIDNTNVLSQATIAVSGTTLILEFRGTASGNAQVFCDGVSYWI